ncbi:hypothetical protein QFC19_003314 [Naganishia cerealis]|uniref:Uncharacterized protein n=1 Tax=Naganishia cerealis TaxID=610337 RepID=A0ACC2W3Y9_9TREE|nr:hypothetical protein QFC19_003314 [Naganishia cerealis]
MSSVQTRPQMDEAALETLARAYLAQKKEISLGPFIIAQFLDAFFLGLVVMQVSTYFGNRRIKEDSWIQKLAVMGVVAINLITSILAIYWTFDLFVVRYGTFAQFLEIKTMDSEILFECHVLLPSSRSP